MIMATKNNHCKTALLTLSLMAAVSAYGQKTTVTGKVYDTDGTSPLIGVTVQQKGQKSGAVTDLDGNFTITVNGVFITADIVPIPLNVTIIMRGITIIIFSSFSFSVSIVLISISISILSLIIFLLSHTT